MHHRKPTLNISIIAGLIINLVMSVLNMPLDLSDFNSMILLWTMILFLLVSILGAILIYKGKTKPGAIMVIVGSILYAPLGFIGIHGARLVLKELKEHEFAIARKPRMLQPVTAQKEPYSVSYDLKSLKTPC